MIAERNSPIFRHPRREAIEIEIAGGVMRVPHGAAAAASGRAAGAARIIGAPPNTRVWIVAGHTDMRRGFNGLAALVQTTLAQPLLRSRVRRRGRRGDIIKTSGSTGKA